MRKSRAENLNSTPLSNNIHEDPVVEARLFHQLTFDLIQQEEPSMLCKKIADTAAAVMHAQYASLQLYYRDSINDGRLHLLSSSGFNTEAEKYWEWVDHTTGSSCGAALREEKQIIINNFETCDFMKEAPTLPFFLNAGIYAAQSTPFYSSDGGMLGIVSTHWNYPHQPPRHRLDLQDVLVRQVGYLLERIGTIEGVIGDKIWFPDLGAPATDYMFRLNANCDELLMLDNSKYSWKSENPIRDWLERFIPGADQAEVMKAISHARIFRAAFQLEHRIVHSDGVTRWLSTHLIPIYTEGEIIEWLGASIDITEIKLRLSRRSGKT